MKRPAKKRVGERGDPKDNLSPLGAKARFDPAGARHEIRDAFVAEQGVGVRAAERLGLSYRGLLRLIDKLQCGDWIDAECERAGHPRHQGRPRNPPRRAIKTPT